jgi:hypothetical protein
MASSMYYGMVVSQNNRGLFVESNISGIPNQYGPMNYVSSDGSTITYKAGDKVLFTNVGRIADNFIILGKVVDIGYAPYSQPQNPYGTGG